MAELQGISSPIAEDDLLAENKRLKRELRSLGSHGLVRISAHITLSQFKAHRDKYASGLTLTVISLGCVSKRCGEWFFHPWLPAQFEQPMGYRFGPYGTESACLEALEQWWLRRLGSEAAREEEPPCQ
jgi:hypothetical protein